MRKRSIVGIKTKSWDIGKIVKDKIYNIEEFRAEKIVKAGHAEFIDKELPKQENLETKEGLKSEEIVKTNDEVLLDKKPSKVKKVKKKKKKE